MLDALTPMQDATAAALDVRDLDIAYRVRRRDRQVIRGLSFRIGQGETFGLVGESGCGKSTVALAVARYLPDNGRVRTGSIHIGGADALSMQGEALRQFRTRSISMVYQDPGRALNPSIRIGAQMAEVFEVAGVPASERMGKVEAILNRVRIVDAGRVMGRYPHELSGGMLQRVVIAMALAVDPTLLILDEPTTALDATVEAEVLDLIETLRAEMGSSVLFIGHNLAVIRRMCARVGVLYAGTLVEEGPTREIFSQPRHPYTVGLLRCLPRPGLSKHQTRLDTIPGFLPTSLADVKGCVFAPRCGLAQDICRTTEPPLIPVSEGRVSRCHFHEQAPDLPRTTPPAPPTDRKKVPAFRPVIRADNISKTFGNAAAPVYALRDVSVEIWPGETLGLVGESGSGKTTLAKLLMGLTPPDPNAIIELNGQKLAHLATARQPAELEALQIVFQNPDAALNRSQTIRGIISRPMKKLGGYRGAALADKLRGLMSHIRLAERYLPMRPRQLSGGLKQRVAIARAFAGDPRIVVCDEPTSALDVSVQAAILNLLADLQAEQGVSYLFVSHDLRVVRYISDRIAVLYLGRLMEIGPAEAVFNGPHHPYTESLMAASAAEEASGQLRLKGEIPSAMRPPSGCVFHTRCPRKIGTICETTEPELVQREGDHGIRCHLDLDQMGRAVTIEA
ncbi:ABC transporter ATP-binding protein [Acidisoma cellulosilytica]|uniref:ABC transporter ATP-binding protein n=1 Tax=Acidisoma cellulosilyticum TaxID=2802395 RepID=A0A963Z0C1_9PROT|nr:ABC transporter ATP-binding protein [Acidisoma cellulosilyticum]MCB8880226.1 ABC transporter ATP-binding protein [Acidisoma cellulosilyticum]